MSVLLWERVRIHDEKQGTFSMTINIFDFFLSGKQKTYKWKKIKADFLDHNKNQYLKLGHCGHFDFHDVICRPRGRSRCNEFRSSLPLHFCISTSKPDCSCLTKNSSTEDGERPQENDEIRNKFSSQVSFL